MRKNRYVHWALVAVTIGSAGLASATDDQTVNASPFVGHKMLLDSAELAELEADALGSEIWAHRPVGASSGFGRYMGSRGLDFLDIVSFNIGIGMGIQPHFQVTRWLQFGLGGRVHGRFAGLPTPFPEYKREWGGYAHKSAEFSLLPITFEFEDHGTRVEGVDAVPLDEREAADATFGSAHAYRHSKVGFNMPSDPVYADGHRDFWAITLGYGAVLVIPLLVGADATADFHPTEFVDFVAGWFGADIHSDDLSDRRTWQGRPVEASGE